MESKQYIKLYKLFFTLLLIQSTSSWDYLPYTITEYNPKTGNADQFPLSAALSNGNYVMVFYSVISATNSNIYFAVYDPKGKEIKPPTMVNHQTAFNCYSSVAADRNGGFSVTWNLRNSQTNASVNDTWVRYYDLSFNAGTPFKINVLSPRPNVDFMYTQTAFLSNGNFIALFNPDYLGSGLTTIFGQQFTAELNTSAYLANQRIADALATSNFEGYATSLGTGEMVLTWHSLMYGTWDVVASIYREVDYAQVKATWRINTTYTAGIQGYPSSCLLNNGTFIIVWCDQNYNYQMGALYKIDGTVIGSNFIINTISGTVGTINVKSLGADGFVTAYRIGNNIYYQLFNLTGSKIGIERKVNTGALAYTSKVWISSNPEKDFFIVYSTGTLVFTMNFYKDLTACADFSVYYSSYNVPKVKIPFNSTDMNYWVNLTVLPTNGSLQNGVGTNLVKSTLYTETDIWYTFTTAMADSFTYTTNYLDSATTCKVSLTPCYMSCYSCSRAGDINNHQCTACDISKGYFPLQDNTSNCFLATDIVPGYFFTNNTWKKCYSACKSCTAVPLDPNIDMKCTSCISNYYPLEDKKTSCFTGDITNYYLDKTKNLYIQCFSTCQSCTAVGTDLDHLCKSCLKNYFPKSDALTSCFTGNINGYYFDSKVYQKCHPKCISCTGLGTDTDNKCTTCIQNYYPKSDDMTNCFSGTFPGYSFDGQRFFKCWSTCKTCTKVPGTADSHQCTACADGYSQMKGSTNCGKKGEPVPGYFYDPIMDMYYPCYKSCKSCLLAGTENEQKCTSCAKRYYSLGDDFSTCYPAGTTFPGYYLDMSMNSYLPCYKTCQSCSVSGSVISHNCLQCKEGFYLTPENMCYKLSEKAPGYYFDTILQVFKKCYQSCLECSKAGDSSTHNCDTCADGLYYLEDNHTNCYSKYESLVKGYFLDSNNFKKCFKTCASCSGPGDIRNPNCLECIDDFTSCEKCTDIVYKDTCVKECPTDTIYDSIKNECYQCDYNKLVYNNACLDSCPDTLIKYGNTCVTCASIGKFYMNNNCVDSCPENYKVGELNACIILSSNELLRKIYYNFRTNVY
jgi:hypothetical protein